MQKKIKDYVVQSDWVLLSPVEKADKTTGGLVKPQQYEDKNEYGVVLSLGPGRYTENGTLIKPQFGEGDTVLYGKYSYTTIRVDGENYNIIKQDDVIAVL